MQAASFFKQIQSGVEVAIELTGPSPDKIFGVREGFQRFFERGVKRHFPISLRQNQISSDSLPMSGPETLEQARQRALGAEQWAVEQGISLVFAVGSESGLTVTTSGDQARYLVDHWTVVRGLGEEAWGSSGCVQIPQELVDGPIAAGSLLSVPGTRRSGGMASSLTGGIVTRRSAASQSTFHALCTLFYGRLNVQARD